MKSNQTRKKGYVNLYADDLMGMVHASGVWTDRQAAIKAAGEGCIAAGVVVRWDEARNGQPTTRQP